MEKRKTTTSCGGNKMTFLFADHFHPHPHHGHPTFDGSGSRRDVPWKSLSHLLSISLTLHLSLLILLFSTVVSTIKLNSNEQEESSVQLPTIDGQIASISRAHDEWSSRTSSPAQSPSSSNVSGCTAPEVLVNGSPSASIGGTVNGPMGSISEIQFVGIVTAEKGSSRSQKRICKIKCLNGLWIGPLCALQNAELFEPILRPCSAPVIGNATISEVSPEEGHRRSDEVHESGSASRHSQLPHGSIIRVGCSPPGQYKLVGTSELTCVDGLWSGAQLPQCALTTVHSNFSVDSAPTIVYTLLEDAGGGSTGVDSRGRLIVPPTSMIHLDCLFLKTFGQPRWTVVRTQEDEQEDSEVAKRKRTLRKAKSSLNSENTGWAISSSPSFSQYRLALYSASSADSGRYTCHTPNGLSNEVEILVKDVQCTPMESVISSSAAIDRNRVHSISGHRMNDRVKFGCLPGYHLKGARESVCTGDGRWSRPVPHCTPIRCPLDGLSSGTMDPKLFISVQSINDSASSPLDSLSLLSSSDNNWASVGSSITFRCATGYGLIGAERVTCAQDARWTEHFPKCQLIVCDALPAPANGEMTEASGRYLLGDFLQFQCHSGYALKGHSVATCQADGSWSSQTPLCISICPYPSSLHHGHLLPTKVQYESMEKVTVVCERSYTPVSTSGQEKQILSSTSTIICLSDGTWSDNVQCMPT